jgi:hypothetical protein
MDEFSAIQRLLAERPPPTSDVIAAARSSLERAALVPPHGLAPLHLNDGRGAVDPGRVPGRRRWRGWLAPVAAAVAVATAVAVSVAISGTVGRHQARKPAASASAFAQVPRFFVALTGKTLPDQGQRAVVVATATGAVLGRVTPPWPHSLFTWVAAAGNDRTFVLAVQHAVPVAGWPAHFSGAGPAKFYRLVLGRSGRPGPLTALPAPPVTGDINGFALSPDGSKLAVTVLPPLHLRQGRPPPPRGSRLRVFTLATGAERDWVLPGIGWIGDTKPSAQSLSWADDDRTLLVQERLGQGGPIAELRLLDTSGPGGSLPAASKRVPIPSADISGYVENPPLALGGPLLITGDGTKIVGTTGTLVSQGSSILTSRQATYLDLHRQCGASIDGFTKQNGHFTGVRYIHYRKTASCLKLIQERDQYFRRNIAPKADHTTLPTSDITITEISVQTGKPVLVLGQRQVPGVASQWVLWTNATGTAMIVAGPGPQTTQRSQQTVLAVQVGNTFTPLPKGVQSFLGETPTW